MESDPVYPDDDPQMSDLAKACSEKFSDPGFAEEDGEAASAFEPEPRNGQPHHQDGQPHHEDGQPHHQDGHHLHQDGQPHHEDGHPPHQQEQETEEYQSGVETGEGEIADAALEAALGSETVAEYPTEQSESAVDTEDLEMKPDEVEEESKLEGEPEQNTDSEEPKPEGVNEETKAEKTTEDGDTGPMTGEDKEAADGEKNEGAAVAVEDKAATTVSDEEYYATLDPEELDWYKEHAADYDKSLNCTACFKQVSSDIGSPHGICRHPELGVGICQQCRTFYKDGNWQKDEDGYDVFCRWCAEGGELILCDKCPSSFCNRCLERNLGRKFVTEITSTEEWKCFVCDPKQIYELRALYHAVFTHQAELKEKKSRKSSIDNRSRAGSESGENFLDENLTEAYTILDTLRKALDDVKESWETANKVMEPEIATTITRKLRNVFAINKQSMDQLDKSIVVSFVGTYPHQSKRIHMGKVNATANIDDDDFDIPPQPKRSRKPSSKKGKKKVAKKVLKVPAKSGKKGVIVVNGRPVTGEYVSPAVKKGPVKKRPAAANYEESDDDEDSDIEVLGTLAPPPLKKRKTGTKSRY